MNKKWLMGVGALLVIVIGVFVYLYFFHGDTAPMLADNGPEIIPQTYLIYGRDIVVDEGSENIADTNVKQRVETDLVLVASFDPEVKSVQVSFIPPNTVVEENKVLKDLYEEKGIQELISGVENLIQKEINHYIGVDYEPFIQLIDVLKGIEIKMDETIELEKYGLSIHPGINKLNGEETLKLIRLKRGKTTILERIERQKAVVSAIYQRLNEINNLSQIQEVSDAVLNIREQLETDIQSDQVLAGFKFFGQGIDSLNVNILSGELVDGLWVPKK